MGAPSQMAVPIDHGLSALTADQMETRNLLRSMTEARMAAFDNTDISGTMHAFLEASRFVVKNVDGDDLVVEGHEAIQGLEEAFMAGIKENFGKSYHELGQWKWETVGDDACTARVYCKLWLADKASGNWQ